MIAVVLVSALTDLSALAFEVLALAPIAPFLVFGIWSLQQRFRHFEEWTLRTQALVLLMVLAFYCIEIPLIGMALQETPVHFVFALLGLLVAGLALYGHILVSFCSQLIVELVVPDLPMRGDQPRLGPAESLERQQDWEGALNEYYVLARVFPGNSLICARVANNLMRLERYREAAEWLDRALAAAQKREECLAIVRRTRDAWEALGEPRRAARAYCEFTKRFPDHPVAQTIREELPSLGVAKKASQTEHPTTLVSMEADQDRLVEQEDAPEKVRDKKKSQLDALEDTPLGPPG